jgi:NAD(P)-dependent dehydrogenase (short-subunit alcohol dehydrogenase family)
LLPHCVPITMVNSRSNGMTMLLKGKSAIIYGASGGVGRVVAGTFAREGATVFLAGRTLGPLEAVAQEISKSGGAAEVAKVDALSPQSVEEHLREVIGKVGKLGISFNLISANVGMGSPLTELSEEQFTSFGFTVVRSNFVTATAAARQMEKQGSGVILGLTASNARIPNPKMGGFAIGGAAIEAFCRQLALEVGPQGVRVVCLRTGGTPDNPILQQVFAHLAKVNGTTKEAVEKSLAEETALKRLPLLYEVANAAVLMASDYASAITATAADVSCGDIVD